MAEPKKRKWIKAATAHKGAFKAKAEKAGETTREFARKEDHAPGKIGKEARLAETLMGLDHGGSKADRLYRHKRVRKG